MARRADHTREELKELAIRAGLELIKKEGFSGFSARKVASRIGYTVGTLYNVFGDYDTLILSINAVTLDDWFAFMRDAIRKSRKGDVLHTLAKSYIAYSREHYPQWVTLFEYHTASSTLPAWYLEKMLRFFTLVEDTLQSRIGDKKKARRAARVLWAGIHGICILSLSGKLDLVISEPPETLAVSFVDNYLAGLAHEK